MQGHVKQMRFEHSTMDAVAVGNFDVASQTKDIYFSHTGTWYEYFTGQSITVNNTTTSITLDAGEYRLYTDVNIPGGTSQFSVEENNVEELIVFPNPNSGTFKLYPAQELVLIQLYSNTGVIIPIKLSGNNIQLKSAESVSDGIYYLHILTESNNSIIKPIIIKKI